MRAIFSVQTALLAAAHATEVVTTQVPIAPKTETTLKQVKATDTASIGRYRRQNPQLPIQLCPEFYGLPKRRCQDCGGNDGTGKCRDKLISGDQEACDPPGCGYYCPCTEDGTETDAPAPGQTMTITTVIDGETVTGVFTATTLSEYQDIRSKTSTVSTKTSDDGGAVATGVAIAVFVGGVAWWLLSTTGGSLAALAGAAAASKPPEGSKEDDLECNPEPKCDDGDCGGKNSIGLCGAGSKANCPCEEDDKECPAEPPTCSSADCSGNSDLKCTADEVKDCQCCPDEQPKCSDEGCEPSDDGRCGGDKFKGCSCTDNISVPVFPYPNVPPPTQQEIEDVANEIFQNVFHGDLGLLQNGTRSGGDETPEEGQRVSIIAADRCMVVETSGTTYNELCPAIEQRPNHPDRLELATDPSQSTIYVIIYGFFDRSQEFLLKVKPGCKLDARWPSTQDAMMQADGRLYDKDGIVFNWKILCQESAVLPIVPNPYARDQPPNSDKIIGKGDFKGKNCDHTNQEMFLGALSRINDNAIITGKTLAIWPIQDAVKVVEDPNTYFESISNNLFALKEYTNRLGEVNKRGVYVEFLCPEGTYMLASDMKKTFKAWIGVDDGCSWQPLHNGCTIKSDTCDDCKDEAASYALHGPNDLQGTPPYR